MNEHSFPAINGSVSRHLLDVNHEILSMWSTWLDRGVTPPPREPTLFVTFVEEGELIGQWNAADRTITFLPERIPALLERVRRQGHTAGYCRVATEFALQIERRSGGLALGQLRRTEGVDVDGLGWGEIVELTLDGRGDGQWLHVASGLPAAPRSRSLGSCRRLPFLAGLAAMRDE